MSPSVTDADRVAVELGRVLTGEELPLIAADAEGIAGQLAKLGWDANRLASLRQQRQDAGEPWPFAAHADAVAHVGFATFHAQLMQLRTHLGLTGLQPTATAYRPWNADERRLAADRPPHWG